MDIKAVLYGVGAIGALIGRVAIKRGVKLVGAVDIDPAKVGKDLGIVIGLEEKLGIKISKDLGTTLSKCKPDIVLHATGSFLDRVYPQLIGAMESGADVISTCETLAYPYYRYPKLSKLLDTHAKIHDVTLLGCGINPGFILDLLPAIMSTPLIEFTFLKATRCLDALKRRRTFQRKIGLGLTPRVWRRKYSEGEITGHVGYAESVFLIASMMGLKMKSVEERQEPIIAERDIKSKDVLIREGEVAGIRGIGEGICSDGRKIIVELIALAGGDDFEEIILEGEPSIKWRSSGTPGDLATAAILVNMIPNVLNAEAGLLTINDVGIPSWKELTSN